VTRGSTVRARATAWAALAALILGAGCGAPDPTLPEELESAPASSVRGPVELRPVAYVRDPFRITLVVPTCGGLPEVVRLDEGVRTVEVAVVSTSQDPSDGCEDDLDIVLDAPLDGRAVVDATSGATLELLDDEPLMLECLEADHAWEPSYPTPEEALEAELRERTPSASVPDDVEAYVRSQRGQDTVAFELVVDEHTESTWLVQQDGDGRWGVVSLSACEPAG
jgi:hypothetical protein